MVQLLGAVLVAAGCAWLGFGAAASLSRRAEGLEDMASALALLERELELGAPPLPALMEALARRAPEGASPLFRGCCQGLERLDEEDFSSLWRRLAAGCDDLGREGWGMCWGGMTPGSSGRRWPRCGCVWRSWPAKAAQSAAARGGCTRPWGCRAGPF